MKVSFISLAALCLCLLGPAVHAQTKKGSFLLGGSLGFSSDKDKSKFSNSTYNYESKSTTFSIRPSISYFVIDQLSVGIVTPFSYTKTKVDDQQATTTTYSIGPVVRYYFPLGDQWAVFPEVAYSYGWMWSKSPYFIPTTGNIEDLQVNGTTRIFQGGVGLVYFLNPSIGIEGKVYYQSSQDSYDRGERIGIIQTGNDLTSFNFSVGLQIYFARNTK
ncbi:MAG TPA: outer membrane beta-barrel protein [Chryseolinea sp.]